MDTSGIDLLKTVLWQQFGASIKMLENSITCCPEDLWTTHPKFWYNAFHCLFFLDYYLTLPPVGFSPPSPFTLSEFEDVMPQRTYTQSELLNYLNSSKKKCQTLISGLTAEEMHRQWINESNTMRYSLLEILLYNMRHVQHHAGQLNMLLRQELNDAPDWVFRAS